MTEEAVWKVLAEQITSSSADQSLVCEPFFNGTRPEPDRRARSRVSTEQTLLRQCRGQHSKRNRNQHARRLPGSRHVTASEPETNHDERQRLQKEPSSGRRRC